MIGKYIRVSTDAQKTERQVQDGSISYIDKVSGIMPFFLRKGAKLLMDDIYSGKIDKVIFHSVDRIGRRKKDIMLVINTLIENNIEIEINNISLNSNNKKFKKTIKYFAKVAEYDLSILLERQKEGIEIARENNVYKGRQKGTTLSNDKFLDKYKEHFDIINTNLSLRKISELTEISTNTIRKIKKLSNFDNYKYISRLEYDKMLIDKYKLKYKKNIDIVDSDLTVERISELTGLSINTIIIIKKILKKDKTLI